MSIELIQNNMDVVKSSILISSQSDNWRGAPKNFGKHVQYYVGTKLNILEAFRMK